MKKEIMYILPFFEERMWGGTRLAKEFGYKTDVFPIGEVYNVVALKHQADCIVKGKDITLSELYEKQPQLFNCETKELPIRVNILDPIADLSVQIHPDDTYALKHNNSRGKPEAWVILDCPLDGYIEFGHNASTKEEFVDLVKEGEYKKLFRYLPTKKDMYIDIPAGTLHAIGKNVLTYNISRNTDLTYRLYDYDRINPSTGLKRQLHIQEVIDNILIPDHINNFVSFPSIFDKGCELTEYWDEPGLYTLKRIKITAKGRYEQECFIFITVYEGTGTINKLPLKKGDTVFIPDHMGELLFEGSLDMFLASYRNNVAG
jgi:mannose-6-phosphate isomerase